MKRLGGVRILSGWAKGRRLTTPVEIRPTQAIVREAISSIWATQIPGAKVLDLFSGSGAVGLELLSRGAREVTFVESSPRALKALKENLEHLKVNRDQVVVWPRPASETVEILARQRQRFDLIYADPPYRHRITTAEFESWVELLVPGGSLAVELARSVGHSWEWDPSQVLAESRSYGDTEVLLFVRSVTRRAGDPDPQSH